MNIIPKSSGKTPNYWCTWLSQNDIAAQGFVPDVEPAELAFLGDRGAQKARDVMHEQTLFDKPWALAEQFEDIRGELIFMLDDGWDVPYGVHPDKRMDGFGSLELNKARFPSCQGTPAQRLKTLSDRFKALGWKGLGVWVCAHRTGKDYRTPLEDDKEIENYYRQRILWSKEAGVAYWKVDWGAHDRNPAYREMITRLAAELYPELIVEHAVPIIPINAAKVGEDTRFVQDEFSAGKFQEVAPKSTVFRSYDYLNPLAVSTTLDRLAFLFEQGSGLVNCEDVEYVGAALGCALGLMKSELFYDKRDETIAAVRWLGVAPAFAGGSFVKSESVKEDKFFFENGSSWFSPVIGKEITQGAPSVMARNMPLPVVRGENPPYVVASKNPNGAVAVAAVKASSNSGGEQPPEVMLQASGAKYVGVFGDFEKLVLQTGRAKRVFVQNLAYGNAKELFGCVFGEQVVLTKEQLCSVYAPRDSSQNAVILEIEY